MVTIHFGEPITGDPTICEICGEGGDSIQKYTTSDLDGSNKRDAYAHPECVEAVSTTDPLPRPDRKVVVDVGLDDDGNLAAQIHDLN
jgi:hypothetical protein